MNSNPYRSPADVEDDLQPKRIAQELEPEKYNEILFEIHKNANSARLLAFIGFLIFFFAVTAWISGKNALHLIAKHDIGHEYEQKAKTGIRLAAIALGLYLSFIIAFTIFVVAMTLASASFLVACYETDFAHLGANH